MLPKHVRYQTALHPVFYQTVKILTGVNIHPGLWRVLIKKSSLYSLFLRRANEALRFTHLLKLLYFGLIFAVENEQIIYTF